MAREPDTGAREERLAAKLRENLRRRKAQARAQGAPESAPDRTPGPSGDGPSQTPPEQLGRGAPGKGA